ncbi:methyltransferase domain-containing protein [Hippea alviniae]|uniref:methyltransferase domain-containing protein n=1 Tax=Hippea alviniae TaxID=1279027 RepID=UPI0003B69045|nr:methyltransferase domain-containing protein [Hippea alviniae]
MGFDKNAWNYLVSSDHRVGEDLEFIRVYFKGLKFEKLLDIASGAGHFANIFDANSKVISDISLNMLKTAKKHYGFEQVVRCDAMNLPFKDNSFDIATCRIAFHHFRRPFEFFKEVHRILKLKAFFVLIDSIVDIDDKELNRIEKIRDKTHYKSHTVEEILSFAKGFRLISFHTIFKRHNFEEWAARLSPDKDTFNRIENAFLELNRDIKNELKVEIKDGKVVSYTDKKGIFIFQRLGG